MGREEIGAFARMYLLARMPVIVLGIVDICQTALRVAVLPGYILKLHGYEDAFVCFSSDSVSDE